MRESIAQTHILEKCRLNHGMTSLWPGELCSRKRFHGWDRLQDFQLPQPICMLRATCNGHFCICTSIRPSPRVGWFIAECRPLLQSMLGTGSAHRRGGREDQRGDCRG